MNSSKQKRIFVDWVEEKEWNRYKIRVGEKPLQVLVNTDDPGIMPTSLRMEFDLLRRAALSHDGASAESAAAWVERFRAAGKVEFEEKHASVFAAPS